MKRFLILILITAITTPALAASFEKGMHETRAGATLTLAGDSDDAPLAATGGLGYFVEDNVLCGGYVSFTKTEWDSYWGVSDLWGLGAYAEYSFSSDSALVPYVGAELGLLNGSSSRTENDAVMTAGLTAGSRYFITDTVSIYAQLGLTWASEEIYDFDRGLIEDEEKVIGAGDSTAVSATIGVRFLLY